MIRQQLIGEYNVGTLDEIGNLPPDSIKGLGIDSVTEWSYPICSAPEKFPQAKRWVLVDEGVFSAADAFTSYCKDTGWATVVGRKTSGDGSGQRIMVALPNTGLIVEFSVMTTLNSKGEPNVLCGTCPDLPTKPSESPLQTLYRFLEDQNTD
jgi:C-terminal processing protease CtpA/Prc